MVNEQTMRERLPYDTEPIPEQGIDLVSVFVALLSEWRIGLIAFIVAAAAGLGYVYSLKPQYVATATFLPSQHTATPTLNSLIAPTAPGNLYIGLMRSRSVQDDVINQEHLLDLFHTRSYEAARYYLGLKSFFSEGADSIITIAIRDENAQNAARIANAYLNGLQDLNDKMSRAQANISRKYVDRELLAQEEDLDKAEQDLVDLQEKTGEVQSEAQASIGINNIAGYRSQIAGLQVQLAVLKKSETDENPEVQRVRSQIAQLQAEEREQEAGKATTPVGAPTTAYRIPSMAVKLNHAQTKVADRRALVNSLSTQLGAARIDSGLSHPVFQVIDRAIPPEGRAWPPRQTYQVAALGFALFVAFFAVLIKLIARRILSNPEHRASLGRLRGAF